MSFGNVSLLVHRGRTISCSRTARGTRRAPGFYPALRRSGLRKIRFHDLRHTFASLLIANGEHPKRIQALMGHSSINVTMDVYGHLMPQGGDEVADRLGTLVFGASGSKTVAALK